MGQYHQPFNLDKREYLDPHKLGDGLKILEQICGCGGVSSALVYLLAASNGRGGGDFPDSEWVGHWGGDRIVILGDYAEPDDLEGGWARDVWESQDRPGGYTDITDGLIPDLEIAFEVIYVGKGWRRRVSVYDIEGAGMVLWDMENIPVVCFNNEVKIPFSVIREAVQAFYAEDQYRQDALTMASLNLLEHVKKDG